MKGRAVAGLARLCVAAAAEESEFVLGGATNEMAKGLRRSTARRKAVIKAGFLIGTLLLAGCASDAGYLDPQGFRTCDRNGGQEERKACLP